MINLPAPPSDYDPEYVSALIRALEQYLSKFAQGGSRKYVISNFTPTRTVDLKTATQVEINNFVLTAINDLYLRGLLS